MFVLYRTWRENLFGSFGSVREALRRPDGGKVCFLLHFPLTNRKWGPPLKPRCLPRHNLGAEQFRRELNADPIRTCWLLVSHIGIEAILVTTRHRYWEERTVRLAFRSYNRDKPWIIAEFPGLLFLYLYRNEKDGLAWRRLLSLVQLGELYKDREFDQLGVRL